MGRSGVGAKVEVGRSAAERRLLSGEPEWWRSGPAKWLLAAAAAVAAAVIAFFVFGGGAPDDTVGVLSFLYGNGPGDDVLVECDIEGQCSAFLAPSFFGIEYDVPPFVVTRSEPEIGIVSTNYRADAGALYGELEAATADDGTESPGGEFQVVEGSVIIEVGDQRSITLFADPQTFWFP